MSWNKAPVFTSGFSHGMCCRDIRSRRLCSGTCRTWIKAVSDTCNSPGRHRRHQRGVLGNRGCAPMSHRAIVLHLLVNEEAISSCEHSAALWEEALQRGACPMAWNCQNFETNVIHPLKSTNAVTAQRT